MNGSGEVVIFLPAPDTEALAEKLRIYLIETEDCSVSKVWHAAMLADAEHLAAEGLS